MHSPEPSRVVRWKAVEGDGLEHLLLRVDDAGVSADGMIIGKRFGAPYAVRYHILCDAGWRVRRLGVDSLDGGRLVLLGDGQGRWTDGAGQPIKALDGAIDVDLTASCFTNTLPLRRLGRALAERTVIDVAYVHIPSLDCTPARQAYTRIAPGRVLYEGIGSDFQAELDVDEDDLVLRYPGLFDRLGV